MVRCAGRHQSVRNCNFGRQEVLSSAELRNGSGAPAEGAAGASATTPLTPSSFSSSREPQDRKIGTGIFVANRNRRRTKSQKPPLKPQKEISPNRSFAL